MKKMRIVLVLAFLCAILPGISQLCQPCLARATSKNAYDTIVYITYYKTFNTDTIIRRPLYVASDTFMGRLFDSIGTFPCINGQVSISQQKVLNILL